MRLLCTLSVLLLAGCSSQESEAIAACEAFIKDRLRSPSTYERIDTTFSNYITEADGKSVKAVFIEYDASNAYGTPIRSTEMCQFEVTKEGQFVGDIKHAARMSAITSSEFASCCVLDKDGQPMDAIAGDAMEAANEAAEAASEAAEAAAKVAERAAE